MTALFSEYEMTHNPDDVKKRIEALEELVSEQGDRIKWLESEINRIKGMAALDKVMDNAKADLDKAMKNQHPPKRYDR